MVSLASQSPPDAKADKPAHRHPARALPKRPLIAGIIIVLALAAGAAGYWLMPFGMTLVQYTYNENETSYSIKVPQNYAVDTDTEITRVAEQRDGIITSGVLIASQPFVTIGAADETQLQEQLKASTLGILADMLQDKYQVENLTLNKADDKNGNRIYRATANLSKDGQTGSAVIDIVITNDWRYTVAVVSELADSRLLKNADAILASFAPGR